MSSPRQRFYREVSVEKGVRGYAILLDGKPIKTPACEALDLPSRALAHAVAEEWRSQGAQIRPQTMLLTKLANTAIDRVAPDRQAAITYVLGFGKSDLLCYRAETPAELKNRQALAWDPLIVWIKSRHGAGLEVVEGVGFRAQLAESLAALERAIAAYDDFALAGLYVAASLCGSAVIGLALADGRLDADAAFAVAHVDEVFQAERWGVDPEAAAKSGRKKEELSEIARFFVLLRE